jgi:hypothetical protein
MFSLEAAFLPDKLLVDLPLLRRFQHIFSLHCAGDLSAA